MARPIIDQSSPNIFTGAELIVTFSRPARHSYCLWQCPFHTGREHVENTVASAVRASIL